MDILKATHYLYESVIPKFVKNLVRSVTECKINLYKEELKEPVSEDTTWLLDVKK